MRKLIGAVVALTLMPSTAWAEWLLEVTDLATLEVRMFSPPVDTHYNVPMSLGGWRCVVDPDSKREVTLKPMTCTLGDANVDVSAARATNGTEVIRLYTSGKKGFALVLSWKSDR